MSRRLAWASHMTLSKKKKNPFLEEFQGLLWIGSQSLGWEREMGGGGTDQISTEATDWKLLLRAHLCPGRWGP